MWKMKKSKEDIYASSRIFFYTLKSLGMAHYQFDPKTSTFKVNAWNYVGIVLTIFIWIAMTVMATQNFEQTAEVSSGQSKILDRLWQYQHLLQNFFGSFLVLFSFVKRKRVENFLMHISTYDKMIENLGWKKGVRSSKWRYFPTLLYLMAAMTILVGQVFAIFGYELYFAKDGEAVIFVKIIAYIILTEFYLMTALKFILSTFCIHDRLRALKESIR